MLLDRIQYDLFRKLNRKFNVQFATFFCNSTAHFQHYYWRNMQLDLFSVAPSDRTIGRFATLSCWVYQAMDKLLGRILRDFPNATHVLCTGLSQQPWLETTKCTYRPVDFGNFLKFSGVHLPAEAIKPVMAEQFFLECGSEEAAQTAENRLRELSLENEPVMAVERQGTSLFTGCRITRAGVLDHQLRRGADLKTTRFGDYFHMVHSMRSGRHHPDGVLWVSTGAHSVVKEKVPLTSVAPTILTKFGVSAPAHMRGRKLLVQVMIPAPALKRG
jgi:hypothetical protein